MNAPRQPWLAEPRMRRASTKVALVLLGTAGIVGVAAMVDAIRKARESSATTVPQPASPPIAAGQTYANNDFIPGVGYYHAPYHAWYPHPYNYYDPMRGYFAGGLWAATPFILNALRSQPSNDAVLAAQRAWEMQQRQQQQQASGFASGGYRSSGGGFFSRSGSAGSTSSSPAPTPSHGSTIRGGFGSSGHSSGGAS